MKKCPYCAEEIQDEAIKCKHCQEFLDPSKRPLPSAMPADRAAAAALPWYFRTSLIVLMFLTFPPFALPSVWLHPKWPAGLKLAITVAVAGVSWAVLTVLYRFIHQFDELTRMLDGMAI